MKYLIDTQILIWYQLESNRLSENIYTLLNNTNNIIFVSQLSLFEIAIKQKLNKLPEFDLPTDMLAELLLQDGFSLLDIKTPHIHAYQLIPLLPEHRDPFDRLLLATALSEQLTLISADANFSLYAAQIKLIDNR